MLDILILMITRTLENNDRKWNKKKDWRHQISLWATRLAPHRPSAENAKMDREGGAPATTMDTPTLNMKNWTTRVAPHLLPWAP